MRGGLNGPCGPFRFQLNLNWLQERLSRPRRWRLPGRGLRPGRRAARPDRFGHPRRLRFPPEAEEPCGEVGEMSLKRQQEGFVGKDEL
jgi:hypothetical protein